MHRSVGILLLAGALVWSCDTAPAPSGGSPVATPLGPSAAITRPTPVATRSASPSATATPGAVFTPAPAVPPSPAGSQDLFGLADARLDVPLRQAGYETCAQGPRTKFVDGRSGEITRIRAAIEGDLDGDGEPDVVAGIDCSPGEGFSRQLIAFHRRDDGTFATIGMVVQAVESEDHDTTIFNVYDPVITSAGEIRVQVGDYPTIASESDAIAQGVMQFRTYRWNGTAFVQSAGSTSFVVPPGVADLSVDASPMTYARPVNGIRAGRLDVTVRNNGPTAVDEISVQLLMFNQDTANKASCGAPAGKSEFRCSIGVLDPGSSKTVTFRHSFSRYEVREPINKYSNLQVRIGDQKYSDVTGVRLVFE